MCVGVLPTCVLVYHVYAWCSQRSAKGIGSPRTKVTGGYEPLQGWKVNPGLLQEQKMLLTAGPHVITQALMGVVLWEG